MKIDKKRNFSKIINSKPILYNLSFYSWISKDNGKTIFRSQRQALQYIYKYKDLLDIKNANKLSIDGHIYLEFIINDHLRLYLREEEVYNALKILKEE